MRNRMFAAICFSALAFVSAQDLSDTITLANAAIPTVTSITDTATTIIQDTAAGAAPAVSDGTI